MDVYCLFISVSEESCGRGKNIEGGQVSVKDNTPFHPPCLPPSSPSVCLQWCGCGCRHWTPTIDFYLSKFKPHQIWKLVYLPDHPSKSDDLFSQVTKPKAAFLFWKWKHFYFQLYIFPQPISVKFLITDYVGNSVCLHYRVFPKLKIVSSIKHKIMCFWQIRWNRVNGLYVICQLISIFFQRQKIIPILLLHTVLRGKNLNLNKDCFEKCTYMPKYLYSSCFSSFLCRWGVGRGSEGALRGLREAHRRGRQVPDRRRQGGRSSVGSRVELG